MDQRLPKRLRLTPPREVSRVFEAGRSASDRLLRLYALANCGSGVARVTVAAGRAHGGAVQRNAAKRRCREALRRVRGLLPAGYDFVAVPHAKKEASVEQLQESILKLTLRVTRRAEGQDAAKNA